MVYAQVIVSSRTNVQELTYNVPVHIIPYIKQGSMVIVPLRRKSVRAVVVKLTNKISENIKSRLRDIISIEKTEIGFSEQQINTIERLADYYGSSFSEVAYHALGWPGKVSQSLSGVATKPTFIQASWEKRKKFYADLVNKYMTERSFLFILPSKYYLEDFLITIKNTELFVVTERKDEKMLRQKLESGERFIALGLQKLAFIPLAKRDFMIIDSPDAISMQQQKRPLMSVKQIGKIRAKTEQINLVLGGNVLLLGDYLFQDSGEWRVVKQKLEDIPIMICDRKGSYDVLLPSIIDQVASSDSVLFFNGSKSWAPALICEVCGELVKCLHCQETIMLVENRQLSCSHCGHGQSYPSQCQNCHSSKFRLLGSGSFRLGEKLKQVFNLPVSTVNSLTTELPTEKIVVATEKITQFPNRVYDAVVIVDADWQITDASINSAWHMLDNLMFLRSIAQSLYIQTYLSEHWIWRSLQTGVEKQTYSLQLEERKKYQLFPYGENLFFIMRAGSAKIVKNSYTSICEYLSKYMPFMELTEPVYRYVGGVVIIIVYASCSKRMSAQEKHQLRELLPLAWAINYNSGQ